MFDKLVLLENQDVSRILKDILEYTAFFCLLHYYIIVEILYFKQVLKGSFWPLMWTRQRQGNPVLNIGIHYVDFHKPHP